MMKEGDSEMDFFDGNRFNEFRGNDDFAYFEFAENVKNAPCFDGENVKFMPFYGGDCVKTVIFAMLYKRFAIWINC